MKVYLVITSDGVYQSFDNIYATHALAVKRVKELARLHKEDLEQVSNDFFRAEYSDYTIREEEVLTTTEEPKQRSYYEWGKDV